MKVYITKYALTNKGRIESAEVLDNQLRFENGKLHYVFLPGRYTLFYFGRDAFTNPEDAVKAAEAARNKKIASLKKQIEKLEKMVITAVE